MPVSLAVWSQILKPGDGVEFVPPADLKLANAALGAEIADEKSRSSLRLIYSGPSAGDSDDDDEDDEEDEKLAPVATVLCSLTPGKVEQAMLDLVLEGGQAVAFENTGKNTIYITGNFIDQIPHDDPPSDSELGLPGDEDEEAFSDVEVEADDEDVPMQEPEPPKAKSKKQKKQKGVSISEGAPQKVAPSTSEPKTSKKEKKENKAKTEQAQEKEKPKKGKKGKKSSA